MFTRNSNPTLLINLVFLAPAFMLAIDLSSQVFNAVLAMDTEQLKTASTAYIPHITDNLGNAGTFQFGNNHSADVENRINSLAISVDKMNVFYIGVDNPISIGANIDPSNLQLSSENVKLTRKGRGSYVVKATRPGEATINVTNPATGRSYPYKFRVKRIPNPVVRLGNKTDGLMGSGTFRAQPGLTAWLDNFDFNAQCAVQAYTMYYTRKRQDPIEIQAVGGRFTGQAKTAVQRAQPGDQYAFVNVKVRCPGDKAGRRVNGLAFRIK